MTRIRADRRAGLLLGGAIVFAFVAFGATVVLPATDPALGESTDAVRVLGALEEEGMAVYRSEGCWYCHTQQVRDGDAAIGEPLTPADYGTDTPLLLGSARVGPDLTHVGARFGDAGSILALLRDPRAKDRHSSMPSYAYLSPEDLDALAAYLLALR